MNVKAQKITVDFKGDLTAALAHVKAEVAAAIELRDRAVADQDLPAFRMYQDDVIDLRAIENSLFVALRRQKRFLSRKGAT